MSNPAIFKRKKSNHYADILLRATLLTIAGLLVFHWLGQFMIRVIGTESIFIDELAWRFNVDLELNVPTWYSSFLAATAGWVALMIRGQHKRLKSPVGVVRTWWLIGTALFLIAINEVASFHELLLQSIHIQAGLGDGQSYVANAWLIIMPLIVLAFIFVVWVMYKQLPGDTFRQLFVAVSVYLLGAVVVEYISIPVSEVTYLYNFVLTPLEEGLEMLGLWLVLRGTIQHVRRHLPKTDKQLAKVLG